jgi:hypothetical protein
MHIDLGMGYLPLENGIFLQKSVEVRHKLVDSFSHVHMPNFRPHSIGI